MSQQPDAKMKDVDPKGLIRESYRIEGITMPECRSIFLDWAINVALDQDTPTLIRQLLAHYGEDDPDHPMTAVLKEGLAAPATKGRRGGRSARVPDA
ncbi:hypothetical protein [Nereida sp. MMG025]|uniref:hypothetical protein n=1 Tax=Nereida sp. MMG025 TaxID=2909981 RepID=UPI001F2E31A2|nr:hypothetical protein [Nereida sp. MMG025]MCF6443565.1 hypothetical protein [Nereida sp. MMG025]